MMARCPLTILLIVAFVFVMGAASSATPSASPTVDPKMYVKTACQNTTYPDICYSSLSYYSSAINSNPWRLCSKALSVSLNNARKAKSSFGNMIKTKSQLTKAEKAALKQCQDTMSDSIDQLTQSANIMSGIIKSWSPSGSSNKMSEEEVEFSMSNVKTYVSAAITDEGTCTDGLGEEPVNAALKKKAMKLESTVEQLTSNALALINTLSY